MILVAKKRGIGKKEMWTKLARPKIRLQSLSKSLNKKKSNTTHRVHLLIKKKSPKSKPTISILSCKNWSKMNNEAGDRPSLKFTKVKPYKLSEKCKRKSTSRSVKAIKMKLKGSKTWFQLMNHAWSNERMILKMQKSWQSATSKSKSSRASCLMN